MKRSNVEQQEPAVYNRSKAIELLRELKIKERRSLEIIEFRDAKTIRKKHIFKGVKQFKNNFKN